MPPQVVLDTNVLVAGLRSRRGASFEFLRRIGSGEFELNVSVPLVLEYEEVLRRQAAGLGLSHDRIADVIDYLCSESHHRQIHYLWRPYLRDADDDLVLELAVEAGADFIVTYNVRDFAGAERFGLSALTPADFLAMLEHGHEHHQP